MVNRTYIWIVVVICLIFLTAGALAQDEQWLQYHSAREVRLAGFGSSYQYPEIITEKPAGMELPQFKSEDPIFAKWLTPMVKSGYLWAALDRTNKNGPYDLLYIDSNRNNRLDDETAVTAYRTDQYSAFFGPVKVVFEVEDGPAMYHLNLRYYSSSGSTRRLYVSSGGWYEGEITVNGAKKHCVLFDYNSNGTFNDKSPESGKSDRIRISEKTSQDTRFVGNYIDIDGVLYRPEIARDGACIKLTKAEGVKFGNIRLPESVTEFSAGGENGLFTLKPENGIGSLPIGKYRVNNWFLERKDEKGAQWKLAGTQYSNNGYFDITENKETELAIGEPIVATLSASLREGTHSFNQNLRGRYGETITLTRNGARPQAPKLNIKSKDGTYDRTYSFRYG